MALLTTCLRCAVSGEMTIFVLSFGAVIGAVRALQDRMELRLAEHIDSSGVSGFCWPRARNRLYSARLRAPLFLSGGLTLLRSPVFHHVLCARHRVTASRKYFIVS